MKSFFRHPFSVLRTPSSILLVLFSFCFLVFFVCPLEANIVLKLLGVNPSPDKIQTVELKTHLPEEIEPEDVVEKGDLEILYDTEKACYYVYGKFELGPEETIERRIVIRDIWVISEDEIASLREEAVSTTQLLGETPRSEFLRKSMESKLDDIVKRQEVSAVNPQKHISLYRDNLKLLESVKTDLMLARSLLAQQKPLPVVAIWKVFFGIVGFLAVLGLAFYLVWQRRIKMIESLVVSPQVEEEGNLPAQTEEDKSQEKKLSPEEIERMIGEGDE